MFFLVHAEGGWQPLPAFPFPQPLLPPYLALPLYLCGLYCQRAISWVVGLPCRGIRLGSGKRSPSTYDGNREGGCGRTREERGQCEGQQAVIRFTKAKEKKGKKAQHFVLLLQSRIPELGGKPNHKPARIVGVWFSPQFVSCPSLIAELCKNSKEMLVRVNLLEG